MTRIRAHDIASAAYECVDARRSDDKKKEYGALAHRLPGMILQNGLAQATGFLRAKGKQEHRALLDDLNTVLRAAEVTDTSHGAALHQKIIESDLDKALLLTRRSLEASGWIKRYVQGVLRVDATGEQTADADDSDGEA